MNETYKLFLDLDGCIVNFNKGYKKLTNNISIEKIRDKQGDKVARDTFLNAGSKFWEDLEWIDGGKELYNAASSLFKHVYILSSAGTTDEAKAKIVEKGKCDWIIKNIPSMKMENVIIARGRHQKQKYASPLSILVDDLSDTIKLWDENGGIGILHKSDNYHLTITKLKELSVSSGKIKLKELISTGIC